MKNSLKTILITFTVIAFTGCKKSYTCECRNPAGVSDVYDLKETHAKAKSICEKHNGDANSIPWSETYCELK